MRKTSFITERTLERMERFYSPKYGLANVLTTNEKTPSIESTEGNCLTVGNLVPICYNSVQVARAKTQNINMGSAVSLNRNRSRIKACGEYLERQPCTTDELAMEIMFDSYDNLKKKGYKCLDLKEMIPFEDHLYDDPSFPFPRYDTSCRISWMQGIELVNGVKTWIPAQKAVYSSVHKDESLYIFQLSTGHACGSNFYQAAVGAIHEVIERDSFMLTWHLQIPGTSIEIDYCLNHELKELYDHIRKHLVREDKLYVYDISKTKGVYTILTFIRNDLPDAYGLIVTAASHTNPELAVFKALEELCQCQRFAYYNRLGEQGNEYQQMEIKDITSLHKHFFYYCTGTRSKNINFMSQGNKHVRLSEMECYASDTDELVLTYLTQLFCQLEQPLYLVDTTKTEIQASGFHILKAIIPGYVDLEVTQLFKQINYSRLQKYQNALGRSINSSPHPFP